MLLSYLAAIASRSYFVRVRLLTSNVCFVFRFRKLVVPSQRWRENSKVGKDVSMGITACTITPINILHSIELYIRMVYATGYKCYGVIKPNVYIEHANM